MKNGIGAVLAMAIIPASAFAVDGQVLINQSAVNAAGGFPYTITQSGSYKLSGNLVVPTGVNGFQINADGVTIDLNGFSIIGSGLATPASVAFLGFSRQRIRIMNGTMSGLAGVSFPGFSQYITIENMNIDTPVEVLAGISQHQTAMVLSQNIASHSVIRGVQATGPIFLTCPGLVIDTTSGTGIFETVPFNGGFVNTLGTNCKAVNIY